jgi:hypothetical protein
MRRPAAGVRHASEYCCAAGGLLRARCKMLHRQTAVQPANGNWCYMSSVRLGDTARGAAWYQRAATAVQSIVPSNAM